jgi:hypothetical protein
MAVVPWLLTRYGQSGGYEAMFAMMFLPTTLGRRGELVWPIMG